MAMVVRANKQEEGIGGHISTYASAATLYEVAFNHFLRERIIIQTVIKFIFKVMQLREFMHEHILKEEYQKNNLENFRRELKGRGTFIISSPMVNAKISGSSQQYLWDWDQ
jgi:pyruvate dehydrogenase E1 component